MNEKGISVSKEYENENKEIIGLMEMQCKNDLVILYFRPKAEEHRDGYFQILDQKTLAPSAQVFVGKVPIQKMRHQHGLQEKEFFAIDDEGSISVFDTDKFELTNKFPIQVKSTVVNMICFDSYFVVGE